MTEPVTVSGWYENTDGTWTWYFWDAGRLREGRTVATAVEIYSPNGAYEGDRAYLDARDAGLRDPSEELEDET